MGFPGSSAGQESAYNAGDPGSIPGSGSSPREGIGYPLQYSWAILVGQMIKNPPVMRETLVRSLGQEDPLEKEMATHSNTLAWKMPWMEKPGVYYSPWGHNESEMTEQLHFPPPCGTPFPSCLGSDSLF